MTDDAVDLRTFVCSVDLCLCGGNLLFLTHLLIFKRVAQEELDDARQ